jgi:hypothetical protein
VLGDPQKWPQLNRDSLDVGRFERATFRNLALNSTRIGSPSVRDDAPSTMLLSSIRQCCEIAVRNGVSNPHGVTKQPWTVMVWNFEGSGMGDPGNTVHQFSRGANRRSSSTMRILEHADERDQDNDAERPCAHLPSVSETRRCIWRI